MAENIDATQTITISVALTPAKGEITSLTYPTTAQAPGTAVTVGVNFRNSGQTSGTFKAKMISTQAGNAESNQAVLGYLSTAVAQWTFTMPYTDVSITFQVIRIT